MALAGTCQLPDCPVVDGAGACLLGKSPVFCDNFEPDGEVAASALEAEGDEHPGVAERRRGAEAPAKEHERSMAPAGARHAAVVPEPDGPRRLVDLAAKGGVQLASGLALTSAEAAEVLSVEPAMTVLLAAPPDSGKTTLLAALYESFCVGPVGPWTFAGSLTLFAFLQRSWYASSASGRAAAVTERTTVGVERPWLHLRLGRAGAHCGTLLLADLSGEYFRDVASGQPLGDAAPIAGRARHVVHFVDAALYEAPRERRRAYDAVTSRIRRLSESAPFLPSALHTVVISRSDLCPADYHDELHDRIGGVVSRWLPPARVVAIAARPRDDSPPKGLSELLSALMRQPPQGLADSPPPALRPRAGEIARVASAVQVEGGPAG